MNSDSHKPKDSLNTPSPDSYYGGYPEYGYSPYATGPELSQNHSLKDYFLIIKERIWWLVLVFSVIFIGTLLYTFSATPLYRSMTRIEVLRDSPNPMGVPGLEENDRVRNLTDLNTEVKNLESGEVIEAVQRRIQADPEMFERFMKPYQNRLLGALLPVEVLSRNRKASLERQSRVIVIQYTHPDPDVATKIANLFVDEFINHKLKRSVKGLMKAVDDLRIRADQQRIKVEELEFKLSTYREKHNQVTIDPRDDIDREELGELRSIVTLEKQKLDQAEAQWNLVQDYQKQKEDLWNINIIARDLRVQDLLSQLSAHKINIAALSERYRAKHPQMTLAQQALWKTEMELEDALTSAVEKVESNYLEAKANYQFSSEKLKNKEKDIINLSKIRIQYNSISRDLEVNQELYQFLIQRMQQHTTQVNIANSNIQVVDEASTPILPFSPNIPLNLLLGAFVGLILGVGFVFLVSMLDDRIKSGSTIENILGLPLLGIIPRIAKLDLRTRAQLVLSEIDPHAKESFHSIFSTLNLSPKSKNAKLILVTSTVPNEGKSLVTTNLALTYASHGERVLLIDCDLRTSKIAKNLDLDDTRGLVQHFNQSNPTEEIFIHKEVSPNLDVLTGGGSTKEATYVLNNPRFAELIAKFKANYDRILIDTPPLAIVSDALSVLPLVDGIIYIVRFNAVKLKMAKLSVNRLQESNLPIFGAILNQVSDNFYYSNYGSRLYPYYYIDEDEDQERRKKRKEPLVERETLTS